MRISMIMAMDKNRLVGKDGGLPWHISSDLKYFKRITMPKPIIMGRKTYDSMGKPLPGRQNIVITRSSSWSAEGVDVVGSLEEACALAANSDTEEMMIIGGAQICQLAMPMVQRLYLTEIDHEFEGGNAWLESYNPDEWHVVSSEAHDETDEGGYRFVYYVLERVG